MTKYGPCPHCARKCVYEPRSDRYYHMDGTDNRGCWLAITRGEKPIRPEPENDTGVWERLPPGASYRCATCGVEAGAPHECGKPGKGRDTREASGP